MNGLFKVNIIDTEYLQVLFVCLFVWVEALRPSQDFFQSCRDVAIASWVLPVIFGR